MNNKKYIKPQTETVNFLSSESVMYGIGDGSTPDQFGKPATDIMPDDAEQEPAQSVWDE